MRTLRHYTLLLLAAFFLTEVVVAKPSVDYSERLDALWDFDNPAASETRFRAEVARHPAQSREAVEATTQVARAQGLQRKFTDADRTLDGVQRTLDTQPVRVRVRYLLERGRRDNSSQRRAPAVTWFEQALAASANDALAGATYYRVDALHMLAIASPPEQQLDFHKRAIAAAQAADDERTRGWRASLLHNLGWTMHDRGDDAAALDYWRQALAAREAANDVPRARIARWTVARGLRALGAASTFPAPAPEMQLDHILTDDGSLRVDSCSAPELPISDHRALVVDISRP